MAEKPPKRSAPRPSSKGGSDESARAAKFDPTGQSYASLEASPRPRRTADQGARGSAAEIREGDMDDYDEEDTPPSEAPPQDSIDDPIKAAAGRSVSLRSIRDHRQNGRRYISIKLGDLLADVVDRFAPDSDAGYIMTVEHIVATILAHDAPVQESFIGQYFSLARMLELERRLDFPRPRQLGIARHRIDEDRVVLRWDVVEVLAESVKVRQEVHDGPDELGSRHLSIALLRTKSGQQALAMAGMIERFDRVVQHFSDALQQFDFGHFGDRKDAWLRIALQLLKQPLLVPAAAETRVAYAADRAQRVTVDSLGVREDAAALSDLILLEAAQPPLAIGLFGAWGSGKSTLIKELQFRIHADLEQERTLVAAGLADTSPDTRRVRNVVQIEFNAWAYADSANLWASLTSEIFDQLSVGGLRPDDSPAVDRRFAELVREVKLRNSRAANALRASENDIADLEVQMRIAEREIEAASNRQAIVGAAIAQTAETLFKKEPKSGPAEVYFRTGDVPGKPKKDAIDEVRDALAGAGGAEDRIKAYTNAANEFSLGFKVILGFAKSRRWPLAMLFIAIVLAVGGMAAATNFYPQSLERLLGGAQRFAAWAGLGGAVVALGTFFAGAYPAVRVATMFFARIREQRAQARAKEAEARNALASVRSRLHAAQASRDEAVRDGSGTDGVNAESPAMMLEYLLSDSSDIDALRQQLGIVTRVRRCFEQLDSVIRRMRADPNEKGRIDRIILYIDDLDRCDAEQVSNVLQAVHLLLAFECFVVVVAVDARWLKQSLEKHHEQLQPPKHGEAPDGDRATAADYLEKIFQIPLWVRPLVDEDAALRERYDGYRNFVDALASPARGTYVGALPPDEAETEVPPEDTPDLEKESTSGGFAFVDPVRPEQADRPRREGLRLTYPEIRAMQELGPLAATSPRAVKRMINLYRLLRVRYRDKQLEQFLENGAPSVPSYRELLVALACETGLSTGTRAALRTALELERDRPPLESWSFTKLLALATTPQEKTRIAMLSPNFGNLTGVGMFTAAEEVRRYSFLP